MKKSIIQKTYGIILLPVVALALSGCVKPHIEPHVTMLQKARHDCIEYGATPGSRMFYSCMKSQMNKERYNEAVTKCKDAYWSRCNEAAPYDATNYYQQAGNCKQKLTARCERQASNEYLHRNNAQKYDLNIHDYNHNYNEN